MAESRMVRDTTPTRDRAGEKDEHEKESDEEVGLVNKEAKKEKRDSKAEMSRLLKEKLDEVILSGEVTKVEKEEDTLEKGESDEEISTKRSRRRSKSSRMANADDNAAKLETGTTDATTGPGEGLLDRIQRMTPRDGRGDLLEGGAGEEDEEPRKAEVRDREQQGGLNDSGDGDLVSRINLRVSVDEKGQLTFERRGDGLVVEHSPGKGRGMKTRADEMTTVQAEEQLGGDNLDEGGQVQKGTRSSKLSLQGEVDRLLVDRPIDVKADLVEEGWSEGDADYANLNGDSDLEDFYNELLDEELGETDGSNDAGSRRAKMDDAIAAIGRLDPATVDSALQVRTGLITEDELLADGMDVAMLGDEEEGTHKDAPVEVDLLDGEILPDNSLLRDEVRNVLLENRKGDDVGDDQEKLDGEGERPREPPGRDNMLVELQDLPVTPLEPPGYGTTKRAEEAGRPLPEPEPDTRHDEVAEGAEVRNRDGGDEQQQRGKARRAGPGGPVCMPPCEKPKDCYHLPHLIQPVCACPPHM